MDQGIVIPRYRPDLGIGKSFIDYHATDNPAFDGIASTSIAKMDYIDRPIAQPSHWSRSGKQNVHVRQNFVGRGRAGGYIPPQTDSPECRAGKALDTRRANDTTNSPEELIHVPQHDLTEDEAFPCDELDPPGRLFRSVERQAEERKGQFSFDLVNERLKPLMTITQHCGGNHFSIKGPRYSDPSSPIVNQQVDDYPINLNECAKVADCGISEPIPNKNETNVELYESSGKALSPTKRSARNCRHHSVESTECGQMEDEDDPFLGLEISDEVELRFPEGGERPVKIAHKIRRRSPMNLDGADGELEGSSDDNMKQKRRSPSNLQERTQQAWKSRRQKNSSLRSKRDPQTPRSTNRVSFKGSDTVKYFEPNVDELTDDATEEITIELDDEVADEGTDETATSLDEKSLNSEYTKGLESEVEDMIKDIFFIGNGATSQPGRRKYKHKHEVKKRLRQKDLGMIRIAEDEYRQSEDDDLDSLSRSRNKGRKNDSASKSAGQKPSNQCAQNIKNRKTNDIRSGKQSGKSLSGMAEAESSVWSFVEGSFTAVSSALGLTQEEEAFALKKSKQESSFTESTCPGPILPFETCPLRLTPSHSSTKPAMSDLYVYAQDVVYGPLSKANEVSDQLLGIPFS